MKVNYKFTPHEVFIIMLLQMWPDFPFLVKWLVVQSIALLQCGDRISVYKRRGGEKVTDELWLWSLYCNNIEQQTLASIEWLRKPLTRARFSMHFSSPLSRLGPWTPASLPKEALRWKSLKWGKVALGALFKPYFSKEIKLAHHTSVSKKCTSTYTALFLNCTCTLIHKFPKA